MAALPKLQNARALHSKITLKDMPMQVGGTDIIPVVGLGSGNGAVWDFFSVEANSLGQLHELIAEGFRSFTIPHGGVQISHAHQIGTVDGRPMSWYSAVVFLTRGKTRGEKDILGRKPKDVPVRRTRPDDYCPPPGQS